MNSWSVNNALQFHGCFDLPDKGGSFPSLEQAKQPLGRSVWLRLRGAGGSNTGAENETIKCNADKTVILLLAKNPHHKKDV